VCGAEQGRAGRYPGRLVERLVDDLGSTAAAFFRSWRNVEIQRIAYSSCPSNRSDASTALRTSGTSGFVMAQVNPACIATEKKAAFTIGRSGRPNDTFEAPHVMLLPSCSLIRRMVSSVMTPACGSAATVIAIGSITTSSGGIP